MIYLPEQSLVSHLFDRSISKNKTIRIGSPAWSTSIARFRGFGPSTTEDYLTWYNKKCKCQKEDIGLASSLWRWYKSNDLKGLEPISSTRSDCFPYLEEVCFAHIDRFGLNGQLERPEKRKMVLKKEFPDAGFEKLFFEFTRWEGVYGFGDLQAQNIIRELILGGHIQSDLRF